MTPIKPLLDKLEKLERALKVMGDALMHYDATDGSTQWKAGKALAQAEKILAGEE